MLRYHSYNIVFQEVPDELTLAINLSNCPNGCKGCHSPYLQTDTGNELTVEVMDALLVNYGEAISCLCFMGGDADPVGVEQLAVYVKYSYPTLKIAWYSGKQSFPDDLSIANFDYLKLGPYIEKLGGLNKPTTNQRFYKIENGQSIDCTYRFQ